MRWTPEDHPPHQWPIGQPASWRTGHGCPTIWCKGEGEQRDEAHWSKGASQALVRTHPIPPATIDLRAGLEAALGHPIDWDDDAPGSEYDATDVETDREFAKYATDAEMDRQAERYFRRNPPWEDR